MDVSEVSYTSAEPARLSDLDTNRTNATSYPADSSGACSTSTTATSESFSHDEADRISNTGYSYDNLGRTTTVPAVDTYDSNPSPTALSLTYYADNMVHTMSQDGNTKTFTLDSAERILNEADSGTGATDTNVYADGSDSPAWISTSTGGWSRSITDLGGNLAALESAADTADTTLQLVDLHGDVVATAPDSTADIGYSTYSESTEFGTPRPADTAPTRYGWLGGKRRSSDALAGAVLMGERVYIPTIGRFLETDPVPGGSCNAYDYVCQDPVNGFDLSGQMEAGETGCGDGVDQNCMQNSIDWFTSTVVGQNEMRCKRYQQCGGWLSLGIQAVIMVGGAVCAIGTAGWAAAICIGATSVAGVGADTVTDRRTFPHDSQRKKARRTARSIIKAQLENLLFEWLKSK